MCVLLFMVLLGDNLEVVGECWELGWGIFENVGSCVGSYAENVGS